MLLPLGVKFLPEDDSDQDFEEEPECDLSHISRQAPEKISQPSISNMTPLSQSNLEHEQKILDSFIDSENFLRVMIVSKGVWHLLQPIHLTS